MKSTEASMRMAAFRKSFGSMGHKEISPQYYLWKSKENPFGEGEIHLVTRGSDVAGSASVTPKRVAVNGRLVLAFEIGDTYTNTNYRRQGVFLEGVTHCSKYAIEHGAEFIYGTPNEASLAGYEKKANYQRIPGLRISLMTKYVSRRALESRIQNRIGNGPHSRWLASLILAKNYTTKRLLTGSNFLHEISDPSGLENVDGIWGDRSGYSFFTIRDKRYLSWRYFSNPDNYKIMQIRSTAGVSGLVVTKQYLRGGEAVGAICDVVALDDEAAVAYELFSHAEDTLSAAKCDYIETWCSSRSPYHKWLRRLGFKERTSFSLIVSRNTSLASELLESKGKWHFMFGDSDNM